MANTINIASFGFDESKLVQSIEQLQSSLFELRKEQERYAKESTNLKKSYSDLEKAQIELRKRNQQESAQYKDNSKAMQDIVIQQKKVFFAQKDLAIEQSKVNSEYSATTKIYKELSKQTGNLINVEERLDKALKDQVNSLSQAKSQNKELRTIREQLNTSTDQGKEALEKINSKLDENTAYIKKNVSEFEKQKMAIGDYSSQIKAAFNELNIFNGGVVGFISRSKEAGGAGNLLTNSFKGITTGLYGMVKASLAFIATPIGAVLAALGLVIGVLINYLKSTQEGIDAITAVTRPLHAIFQSLIGVFQEVGEKLYSAFTNPKKALVELYQYIKDNLINRFKALAVILEAIEERDFKKLSNGILQVATGVENLIDKTAKVAKDTANFISEAAKKGQEIDRITKEIEQSEINLNKEREKSEELIKKQKLIATDLSLNIKDRIKAQQEIIRLSKEEAEKEAHVVRLKIEKLKIQQDFNNSKRKDSKELADLQAELNKIEQKGLDAEIQGNKLISKDRKQAHQDYLNDLVIKAKEELNLFISSQGIRVKSMQQELDIAQKIHDKKIDIAKKEWEISNKTATDKLKYQTAINNINNELLQKQTDLTIEQADRELEHFIKNNQSKIDQNKRLTIELVNQEKIRLAAINNQQQALEELRLEQGIINKQEYNDNMLVLKQELLEQEKELDHHYANTKIEDQAVRRALEYQQKVNDIESQNSVLYEKERADLEYQYQEAQIALQEQREQGLISEENYQLALTNIKQEHSNKKREIDELEFSAALDIASKTYGNLSELAGKETQAGKAFATAQTLIDTQQAAMAAYKSLAGIYGIGPALGIAAAAAAVKTGLDAVKKINEVKVPDMPKAEKGAVFTIGGKRHSAGGTKFIGEDGTRFEAEKGEKLFVLNRKASAVISPILSSINQSYGGVPLSNASSYLEKGGVVSSSNKFIQNAFSDMNNEQFTSAISDAVQKGAYKGALNGSSQGTNTGFTSLTNNRTLMSRSYS